MLCFCRSEMEELQINKDKYYRCPKCGYLKKSNILSSSEEKKRYDSHICDEGYLKYMENVYLKVKKYLKEGLSIDYGCGKIHALADIMNEDNRLCKYYDLYYYNDEINDKFDNIILIEVFEHILNPLEFIKNLKSILNDNGNIIIMTKTIKEPLDKWWYLRDSTHISFFKESSMKVLGEMLGFDVLYNKDDEIFKLTKKN